MLRKLNLVLSIDTIYQIHVIAIHGHLPKNRIIPLLLPLPLPTHPPTHPLFFLSEPRRYRQRPAALLHDGKWPVKKKSKRGGKQLGVPFAVGSGGAIVRTTVACPGTITHYLGAHKLTGDTGTGGNDVCSPCFGSD